MRVRTVDCVLCCGLIVLSACRREAPSRPTPPALPSAGHSTPTAATPTANPANAPPAAAIDPPAPPSAFHDTARFLPQGTTVPGWVQSGEVRLASGQELFQLIDGAGEKYVRYGFRQLGRTDYRKSGTELVVTAEIYDMATTLGAFGQYSMLLTDGRDPATMQPHAVTHGGGGFLGTSQLVFWKGQYLVQINIADDSGESDEAAMAAAARDALPAFATRLAAALPGDTTAPAAPPALPRDGLVWGGTAYLADNVFGLPETGPGWVGHYHGEGRQRWRIAVFIRPSTAQATATFNHLRTGPSQPVQNLGNEAVSVDTSSGQIVVVRQGSTVIALSAGLAEGAEAPPRDRQIALLRAALASH